MQSTTDTVDPMTPSDSKTETCPTGPIDVSVVICTVNRPEALRKAVASVIGQNNRLSLRREIVVVDNSADGQSRALVEDLGCGQSLPVRYVGETRMSFAYARNAGARESRGDLLAFLDDDEEASPDWLDELIEAMRAHRADVVFGPVMPKFEAGGPPAWDPTGSYHTRQLDVSTGTEVTERGTGNVLIRRATCFLEDEPFDPALGASGGEDLDFFLRLRQRGRKLIWCRTAPVTELQQKRDVDLSYRSFRNFCQTQIFVKIQARHSASPLLTKIRFMAVGVLQVIVYALPGGLSMIALSKPLVAARLKFFNGLGKLFWMLPSRLYAKRYS